MKRLSAPGPSRRAGRGTQTITVRFAKLLENRNGARDRSEEKNDPQGPLRMHVGQRDGAGGDPARESGHEPEFVQAPGAFVARHPRLRLRDGRRVSQPLEYTNAALKKTSRARRLKNVQYLLRSPHQPTPRLFI